MDAPSAQIHLEIRDAIVRSLATRRPILHHLNVRRNRRTTQSPVQGTGHCAPLVSFADFLCLGRYQLASSNTASRLRRQTWEPHLLQYSDRPVAAGWSVGRGKMVLAAVAFDRERCRKHCRSGRAGTPD
jgi:hypothetical protein